MAERILKKSELNKPIDISKWKVIAGTENEPLSYEDWAFAMGFHEPTPEGLNQIIEGLWFFLFSLGMSYKEMEEIASFPSGMECCRNATFGKEVYSKLYPLINHIHRTIIENKVLTGKKHDRIPSCYGNEMVILSKICGKYDECKEKLGLM